jgi:hypothetical protein
MVGFKQKIFVLAVLFWLSSANLLAQSPTFTRVGMAKPLAGVRDYNGTYSGSIGTGTIGFSTGTLYRDNYDDGVVSRCWGEGCGKHPGVDIPVAAGSNVFASLEGRVVISRCDTSGWGGLVVIRSHDPFDYGTSVYFVYGHLRDRLVRVDQPVTTGQLIGYSGGRPGLDNCAGNSTGAHLHFQVDKDDGNVEPWFPKSGTINLPDSDFKVARNTINPLVFIQGEYRWDFAQAGNREYWDIFNWQSWGVSNSALWFDGGDDPFIRRGGFTHCGPIPCSNAITVHASMYRWVFLDLFNHCWNNPGKIYFTTNLEPNWDEAKSVSYYPYTWGAWSGYVYMHNNPKWAGIITGLRIDPAVACSASGFDPTYIGEIRLER